MPPLVCGDQGSCGRCSTGLGSADDKVHGGVHEPDVREGLRKVAHQPLSLRVVFLRQQPHVITETQQALEDPPYLVTPPLEDQIIGQPKRAGKESPSEGLARGGCPHEGIGDLTGAVDEHPRNNEKSAFAWSSSGGVPPR